MPEELPALALVPPGNLRDHLNDQVLRGLKTATSSLVVMDNMAGTPAELPGTRMRLVGSQEETVAIVEIDRVYTQPFGEIGSEVSSAESEWMFDVADWRAAHTRYWTGKIPEIRAFLADNTWELTERTPVVVRFFSLIKEDQ